MGFSQALSGLNTSSKNLDVIGNNVANANTVGFKQSQAQFADVFAASLQGTGASPIGLGSKLAAVAQQFTQGNVTTTNNPLDMAINGGGFFQLTDATGTTFYSRNGQFQLDKSGNIVNNQGLKLNGYLATANGTIIPGSPGPVQVPTSDIAPQETGKSAGASGVEMVVNLDSRANPPVITPFDFTDPLSYNESTALNVYDSLGNAHTMTTYFVKTATAGQWEVHTTVTDNSGVIHDVTPGSDDINAITSPPYTNPGALPIIAFDTSGQIDLTNSQNFDPAQAFFIQDINSIEQLGSGAADMQYNVNLAFSTQYGSKFSSDLKQDGFASGKLTGFSVSADGILLGRYSNGQSKNLAQLVLSNFRNPQGLQPMGNNVWVETSQSGPATAGVPQTGQFGAIQASAVEDSNVDLTAELVNMITAQRNYQANAQTIKTQDQILQTLVNLR